MKKRPSKFAPAYLIAGAMVFVLLFVFALLNKKVIVSHQNKVCFAKTCFEVEIARSDDEQAKGLMFRKSMDKNRGMLFVLDSYRRQAFWMKNTLITLDIIWMDADGKVVHIARAVPCKADPCPSYVPESEAVYVLEINGGLAGELGIAVGDQAVIHWQ